jgi:hypothetical protein
MKKTKIIGSLILTVLLLMLQVPLDSALFNLGSYMSAFGISLDWLIQHQSMIKVIISIIAVGVLIAILFDKEENQEHHGTTINQSQKVLFGNNNTQNLNIGIEQRKVTKELIGQMPLLKKIEKRNSGLSALQMILKPSASPLKLRSFLLSMDLNTKAWLVAQALLVVMVELLSKAMMTALIF